MKRHLLPLITILVLGFAPVVAQAKTVAVSMKPLHSLVAMVMEGVGTPELLITGTPHGGHLKPSQMRLISRADRIFMVHGALETLLQKPVAEKEGVIALIDTPGMTILELRLGLDTHDDHHDDHAGEGHDDHDDHHDDHAGEGHDGHHDDHAGEGHDDHDDHHDDDHEAHEAHHHVHLDNRDMHIWLDPGNAITMIDRIRDELLAVYPDQAERLNANAEQARMMLQQLNDQIAADLASIEDKRFLVFHDAYQYFERRFGLQMAVSILDHHNARISAPRLQKLEHWLEENPVTCIFAEPQFDSKLAALLSGMSGAPLAVIDPIGADIPPGPDHYPLLMKGIADAMRSCSG